MSNFYTLANLGWQPFFQQQLSLDEWNSFIPARIIEQHKSEITLATALEVLHHPTLHSMPDMTVGDWILLDSNKRFSRLLDRKTCFTRKAAGKKAAKQLISANVDTAFIVCSINNDFNLNRIERFLSLVNESEAEPVVLLSKSDLSDDPEPIKSLTQKIDRLLPVEYINCLDSNEMPKLAPWLKEGRTIVVLGSSGVGKSTLINTVLGHNRQSTANIRQSDDKGHHTTTRRSLILINSGGLILDTPGMREIQLAECKEGISSTFADIETLAKRCRFTDCHHQSEPDCAVQLAIQQGDIAQRRLNNYIKLRREEALNSATLIEKRAADKALGKFYKRTLSDSHKLKGR